jgi:hypothetical protein
MKAVDDLLMNPLLKRHIFENLPLPTGGQAYPSLSKRGNSSLLQSLPAGRQGREGGMRDLMSGQLWTNW